MTSKLSDILKLFAWNNCSNTVQQTNQSIAQAASPSTSIGGKYGAPQSLKPKVIKLNFRDIGQIDQVSSAYLEIQELSLNHNHLQSLDGVEQFRKLRSLHLNFNRLRSKEELLKIACPQLIQELSFKGNPNLEFGSTEEMQDWVLQVFPNLQYLNGRHIDELSIQRNSTAANRESLYNRAKSGHQQDQQTRPSSKSGRGGDRDDSSRSKPPRQLQPQHSVPQQFWQQHQQSKQLANQQHLQLQQSHKQHHAQQQLQQQQQQLMSTGTLDTSIQSQESNYRMHRQQAKMANHQAGFIIRNQNSHNIACSNAREIFSQQIDPEAALSLTHVTSHNTTALTQDYWIQKQQKRPVLKQNVKHRPAKGLRRQQDSGDSQSRSSSGSGLDEDQDKNDDEDDCDQYDIQPRHPPKPTQKTSQQSRLWNSRQEQQSRQDKNASKMSVEQHEFERRKQIVLHNSSQSQKQSQGSRQLYQRASSVQSSSDQFVNTTDQGSIDGGREMIIMDASRCENRQEKDSAAVAQSYQREAFQRFEQVFSSQSQRPRGVSDNNNTQNVSAELMTESELRENTEKLRQQLGYYQEQLRLQQELQYQQQQQMQLQKQNSAGNKTSGLLPQSSLSQISSVQRYNIAPSGPLKNQHLGSHNSVTNINHNISNRYHQSILNEDLGLEQDEDACLDRTTFDQIRDHKSNESAANEGHSQESCSEDADEEDSEARRLKSRNLAHQRQNTQPPTSIVASNNVSKQCITNDDETNQSRLSSNMQKFQAYLQPVSMSSNTMPNSQVITVAHGMKPPGAQNEELKQVQFGQCQSDPKLIVARHVFSDNDDFCKKTLDVNEQVSMVINRKQMTLLYKLFMIWRGQTLMSKRQIEQQSQLTSLAQPPQNQMRERATKDSPDESSGHGETAARHEQKQSQPEYYFLRQEDEQKKFATLGGTSATFENEMNNRNTEGGGREDCKLEPSRGKQSLQKKLIDPGQHSRDQIHSARNYDSNQNIVVVQPVATRNRNNINNFARQFAAGDSFTEQSEDHHQHQIYHPKRGKDGRVSDEAQHLDSMQELQMQRQQFLQEFQLQSRDDSDRFGECFPEALLLSQQEQPQTESAFSPNSTDDRQWRHRKETNEEDDGDLDYRIKNGGQHKEKWSGKPRRKHRNHRHGGRNRRHRHGSSSSSRRRSSRSRSSSESRSRRSRSDSRSSSRSRSRHGSSFSDDDSGDSRGSSSSERDSRYDSDQSYSSSYSHSSGASSDETSDYQCSIQTSKYFTKKQLAKLKRIVTNFLLLRQKSKLQIFFQKWLRLTGWSTRIRPKNLVKRSQSTGIGGRGHRTITQTKVLSARGSARHSAAKSSLESTSARETQVASIKPGTIDLFDPQAHPKSSARRARSLSKKRVAFAIQSLSPTRKVVKNVLLQKNKHWLSQILQAWSLFAQSQQLKRLRQKEKKILNALRHSQQNQTHFLQQQPGVGGSNPHHGLGSHAQHGHGHAIKHKKHNKSHHKKKQASKDAKKGHTGTSGAKKSKQISGKHHSQLAANGKTEEQNQSQRRRRQPTQGQKTSSRTRQSTSKHEAARHSNSAMLAVVDPSQRDNHLKGKSGPSSRPGQQHTRQQNNSSSQNQTSRKNQNNPTMAMIPSGLHKPPLAKTANTSVMGLVAAPQQKPQVLVGASRDFIVQNGMLKPRKQATSSSARASRATSSHNQRGASAHDLAQGAAGHHQNQLQHNASYQQHSMQSQSMLHGGKERRPNRNSNARVSTSFQSTMAGPEHHGTQAVLNRRHSFTFNNNAAKSGSGASSRNTIANSGASGCNNPSSDQNARLGGANGQPRLHASLKQLMGTAGTGNGGGGGTYFTSGLF